MPASIERRTCSAVISWWLKSKAQARSAEAENARVRELERFCRYVTADAMVIGTAAVADVCGADLVEYINSRRVGQWSRRRICSTIKTPFTQAARLGLIERSPFAVVSERKGQRGREISEDEFRGLLRLACPPMRRLLLALRWTGARPIELRNLTWDQIDWPTARLIQVDHKTAGIVDEPRVIHAVGRLIRLLAWLKRQGQAKRYVFLNSHRLPWTRTALCKHIRELRRRGGLPKYVRLYGIRHKVASDAIAVGEELSTVAKLLGHRGLATILTYVHHRDDVLASAAERIAKCSSYRRPCT